MTDPASPSPYTSCLLRVWRVDGEGPCRALLENVATGERVGFNTLSDLIGFLETQTPESRQGATQKLVAQDSSCVVVAVSDPQERTLRVGNSQETWEEIL